MKRWLKDIAYCEFSETSDRELLDRLLLFNIFMAVFLLTAIPFSLLHAARGAYLDAFFLLAGSALLIRISEIQDPQTAEAVERPAADLCKLQKNQG